jgi:hypothetical protein
MNAATKEWFVVDPEGLRKIREGMPKSALGFELMSNVFDTGDATYCDVKLESLGNSKYHLVVTDDSPEGFKYIEHAYTLFAESTRKSDPTKRGRFNLGEKLVIAGCDESEVTTTKGTVRFDQNGRTTIDKKTKAGTSFSAVLTMTDAEYKEFMIGIKAIIVPGDIIVKINGQQLPVRTPINTTTASLRTVLADKDGNMRDTRRKAGVEIYTVPAGQKAWLFELGIPVVETSDKYDVNILQKVPLTMDRTNVQPAFLREVRESVAEAMINDISADDSNSLWVQTAVSNPDASKDLVQKVWEEKFGKKTVIFDPSDPEANARAVAEGYTPVHGKMISKEMWANVKKYQLTKPAGQMFPTQPDTGENIMKYIPESEWTTGMTTTANWAIELADKLMGISLTVKFTDDKSTNFAATYGGFLGKVLTFYAKNLPKDFFARGRDDQKMLSLLIHEFAHEYESNHLSEDYYTAICDLAAKCVRLALSEPARFKMTVMV